MRMVDLINKKKRGLPLTKDEIYFIVNGYTLGDIPDYQMSAFLMAVYFKGMNQSEISELTMAYVESGEIVDLSMIQGVKVDKHSSGGVGDKLSLAILPLCASVGIPVAKMSGRGLGHTGGTIDKLEAIQGFRTELSSEEFIRNVNQYKMAIVGQSPNLTPADKKIYALRDVTGTVDSIPLIAASIMSKKIAAGADCIVLDVKVGSGAFMKSLEEGKELARTMVSIGKSLGKETVAVITNMNEPLGHEVGNANEIKEVIEILTGKGARDETEIALTIASHMAVLGKVCPDFKNAYHLLEKKIQSGEALDKFMEFVKIQGGNIEVIQYPDKLPKAQYQILVMSMETGYIASIEAETIGISAMLLGAGRRKKEDQIDYSAGITIHKKVGDRIQKGELLCTLHTNLEDYKEAEKLALQAFSVGSEKPEPTKYIYDIIK